MFKKSRYHGEGTLVSSKHFRYNGSFSEGLMHGYGVEWWPNNVSYYDGNYDKGKKTGKGKYKWGDGAEYNG